MIVNRLWQHHFGRGIVATPSDFGVRGEPPSHPELLDWLASELVASGWRLKPIHRLMVTSAAYRQSSRPSRELAADDPDNTMLARMNRRRLDAEGVRDAMLVVSGELNPRAGGPGVLAPLEKEVEDLIFTEAEVVDLWPEDRDPAEHLRRSLYLFRKRNVRYPLFDSFDAPDTQTACPRRETSTHALQALVLLNSEFAAARARAAGRMRESYEGRSTTPIRIPSAIYQDRRSAREPRRPRRCERARVVPEGAGRADRSGPVRRRLAAWTDLALAMLNSQRIPLRAVRSEDSAMPETDRSRPADAPDRSRSGRAAAASSSRSPAAASACSAWPTCCARDARAGSPASPLAPKPGHLPAKAKRCIFLFMTGGPSQMDLFDPKPLLNRLDGQPCRPASARSTASSSRAIRSAWEAIASGGSTASRGSTCRTWCRTCTPTPTTSR